MNTRLPSSLLSNRSGVRVPPGRPPLLSNSGGVVQFRNNFDGLRLIAALLVLVGHQIGLQGHIEPRFLGVRLGEAGLAIFFGLSGYLVTSSWQADPQIFRFFARRLLRIWPALAVLIGVLWTAIHILPWEGVNRIKFVVGADRFLGNLMLLPDSWDWLGFFGSNPYGLLDGSLWTIPIEVRCYLLLGLSCWLLGQHVRWLLLPAMVVALLYPESPAPLYACFFAGAAMRFWKHGALLGWCAAAVAAGSGHFLLAVPLAIAPTAVLVGRCSWPVLRHAGERGDFSYGIYLWAWPCAQVGIALFGPERPWLILWTLATSGVIAWLSWHLIESQALKLKPSVRVLVAKDDHAAAA